MTVKERLRRMVEALKDDLPETAVDATEGILCKFRGASIHGLADVRSGASLAATPEERVRAFHRWIDSQPQTGRLLTDEDVSRESLYGDRG